MTSNETIACVGELLWDVLPDGRTLGGFVLIDKMSNATVAAGMLNFSLRRAQNVHWQALDVSREAHATLKNQSPKVLWFTGLSGAGKSTIANLVEVALHARGVHTLLLDGDNVRHGLNKDLDFTDAGRVENIRRIGEVAKLFTEAGLVTLTAFISPYRADRDQVRAGLELLVDFEWLAPSRIETGGRPRTSCAQRGCRPNRCTMKAADTSSTPSSRTCRTCSRCKSSLAGRKSTRSPDTWICAAPSERTTTSSPPATSSRSPVASQEAE